MERIRILLVDDHLIVRGGLRTILEKEPDMEVIGAVGSAEEALLLMERQAPDVALVDIRMPGMSGVELCRRMREINPQTAVLMLTSFLNEELVRECVQAGARGYLLKDVDDLDLVRSVRSVVRGEAAISPKAAVLLMDMVVHGPDTGSITSDELELLRHIARGLTNRDIANLMYLSENTVKDRVLELFRKLKVKGRVEAAMEGVRRGLL
jgi:two-component system, NarL family, response regulator DevR